MSARAAIGLAALAAATPAAAQTASPLFGADTPLQLTIAGPVRSLARDRDGPGGTATLAVAGQPAIAVTLSPRGNFRRQRGTCDFPPLRVAFAAPPPAVSPFAGQKRLKLVTHCSDRDSFASKTLLEYAAYRLFNAVTDLSFRARLARITYVEGGQSSGERLGFFIEDDGELARRIGLNKARRGQRVPLGFIDANAAGRMAMFNYMISNLDWALNASAPGQPCCHNGELFAAGQSSSAKVIPIPYDFDFSGLVDAPYATPPATIRANSVRERVYRGYCVHNAGALAAAAAMRGRQGAILAALDVPGLEAKERERARRFLDNFFREIADDRSVEKKILARCLK